MISRILFDEIERQANIRFPRKSILPQHHVNRRTQLPHEQMASPDVPVGLKGVWNSEHRKADWTSKAFSDEGTERTENNLLEPDSER